MSETVSRMFSRPWTSLPSGAGIPRLTASACSRVRSSSFCKSAVYWLPPTETSRVKTDFVPLRMLMFIVDLRWLLPRELNRLLEVWDLVAFARGNQHLEGVGRGAGHLVVEAHVRD